MASQAEFFSPLLWIKRCLIIFLNSKARLITRQPRRAEPASRPYAHLHRIYIQGWAKHHCQQQIRHNYTINTTQSKDQGRQDLPTPDILRSCAPPALTPSKWNKMYILSVVKIYFVVFQYYLMPLYIYVVGVAMHMRKLIVIRRIWCNKGWAQDEQCSFWHSYGWSNEIFETQSTNNLIRAEKKIEEIDKWFCKRISKNQDKFRQKLVICAGASSPNNW